MEDVLQLKELCDPSARLPSCGSRENTSTDVRATSPLQMGGVTGPEGGVANPEQFFGMAYAPFYRLSDST